MIHDIRLETRERLVDTPRVRVDRVVLSRPGAAGRERVERLVHDHGHAVAVLPVDKARRTVLLTRQLRFPVFLNDDDGFLVEPCAGLIDVGEAPEDALRREAREEMGLRLGALTPVGKVYTSPGFLTETVSLYLADYAPEDRQSDGGGLADEGEKIDVLEWSCADLRGALEAGRIRDAKLLILTQALLARQPELFA